MNELQRVGSGAVADQEKEACVTEVHEAYRAWGTAGLLLVECCVVWAMLGPDHGVSKALARASITMDKADL